MKNWFTLILLTLFLFPLGSFSQISNPTQLQSKIALVIGNGNYESSILANPENDARAMKIALQQVGFEVYEYENLNQSQMKKAIDDFGMKLKGNDVGLFYYAGHGIQSNGSNYLIPVDAQLNFEKQIEYDCVQLDRVLAFMEASGSKVNILILDACRNNPFERSWTRSTNGKGLAFMDAPKGSIIAYATSPGRTASDGSGENGLYTSAILENIIIPNITILQMFQNVRSTVLQKSGQQQMPWESTSLTGDFYFSTERKPESSEQRALQFIPTVYLPKISTPEILSKTSTEVHLKVTLINDGGATVIARGVCYSTSQDPSINNNKTIDGIGLGPFESTFSGLLPGNTYFARAYAINSSGTVYSSQISFTTNRATPVLTTAKISFISSNSLFSGGNISFDGGFRILTRGVCWSTSENPTLLDNKPDDGSGVGEFTSKITGLLPDTTYYLRAYAANEIETSYGNEIVFKTLEQNQYTDIDGNIYNSVMIVSQTWMSENLRTTKFNDGTLIPQVTEKSKWWNQESPSYCWYTNQEEYKTTYGALYNWQAVKSGNLCPADWHVPNDSDWETLISLLGVDLAGGHLKEQGTAHWKKPNVITISYCANFSALPGGFLDETGEFRELGISGYWWSTQNEKTNIRYRQIKNNSTAVFVNNYRNEPLGLSVRCLKNK